jgi:protein-S-isoprenylcysteine O-methyltransferase Ste14
MSRALVALIALVAYAVAAFGWRSWLQHRRYGDTGLRLVPPSGSVARLAHVGLIAAFAAAAVAPVWSLVAGDAAAPGGPRSWVEGATGTATFVAGLALVLVGGLLTLVAQVQMGASWRVGVDEAEQTDLVTGGLFASVRNPIFTSMIVAFAGLALLVPNVLALAGFVVGTVSLQVQVRRVEEPYLARVHGAPYRRWAARAGRFLPGLGRLDPA